MTLCRFETPDGRYFDSWLNAVANTPQNQKQNIVTHYYEYFHRDLDEYDTVIEELHNGLFDDMARVMEVPC